MDNLHDRFYKMSPIKLSMKPSEYFRRQIYATFIRDELLTSSVSYLGATNLMWSSDFPHMASTWPKSHECIDKALGGLKKSDQARMTRDNVAGLYGIG
jgi:hypothetical protein